MTTDETPGHSEPGLVNPPGLLRPAKPADPEGPRRAERLNQLGVGSTPDTEFDAIARRLAEAAADLADASAPPLAMVNFITPGGQYFSGLFVPEQTPAAAAAAITTTVKVGRTMDLDQGWCPHVIVDRRVFPLRDVRAYRRWANNRVTREAGILSYLGGPVIETDTDIALGTVCVVAREPLHWEADAVQLIKTTAAEVAGIIRERNPNPPPPPPP